MHYYKDFSNGYRISLVGTVITVFDSLGRKVKQRFYKSKADAKSVFFKLV